MAYVELMNNELTRVEGMVFDFPDMAGFEAKQFKLDPMPFDIAADLKKHIEAVGVVSENKQLRIVTDFPAGYKTMIYRRYCADRQGCQKSPE